MTLTSRPAVRKHSEDGDESHHGEPDVSRGNQVSARGEGKTIGRHMRDNVHPTAVEKVIQTDSCGGWKVLPGRQWGAGPGSSVTHSQKARTR